PLMFHSEILAYARKPGKRTTSSPPGPCRTATALAPPTSRSTWPPPSGAGQDKVVLAKEGGAEDRRQLAGQAGLDDPATKSARATCPTSGCASVASPWVSLPRGRRPLARSCS